MKETKGEREVLSRGELRGQGRRWGRRKGERTKGGMRGQSGDGQGDVGTEITIR